MEKKKKNDDLEHRSIIGHVEIRADSDEDSDSRMLTGYAVSYNKQSQVMRDWWGDKFVEVIAEGAFDKSLQDRGVLAYWNHNKDILLGNTESGTLILDSDSAGVRFDLDLPKSSWGDNVLESAKRKDVQGVSFGFRVLDDAISKIEIDGEEVYKRTVVEAELYEISPTPRPAYVDSECHVRSIDEIRDNNLNIEARALKLQLQLM